MTLIDLIESTPNWQNKSAADLLSELSTKSIPFEDHSLYTWAGIALIAGDTGASQLCAKLIEIGKLWAVHQLGGAGLDLANNEIQQQLYYLDSLGVPGMANVALAVKRQISPLEQVGISATLEQVSEAKTDALVREAAREKYRQIDESRRKWDSVSQAIRAQIESGLIEDNQVVSTVNQLWSN